VVGAVGGRSCRGAHAYYLVDHLGKRKDIKVIPATAFLPLTAKEVSAQTLSVDHLKALRLLNFQPGVIPVQKLADLERRLKKVEDLPEFRNDYHLFRGKFLLHVQNPKEALDQFEKVAAVNRNVLSSFDSKTRLREAAIVYSAQAKSALGRVAEAKRELNALLSDETVSAQIRQWAQQVMQGMPTVCR